MHLITNKVFMLFKVCTVFNETIEIEESGLITCNINTMPFVNISKFISDVQDIGGTAHLESHICVTVS